MGAALSVLFKELVLVGRFWAGMLGFVGGLLLAFCLASAGVIQIGWFAPSRGLWLVPLLLIAGPVVAILWDEERRGLALAILGILLVPAAPLLWDAGQEWWGRQESMAKYQAANRASQAEANQARQRAEALVRAEFGPGTELRMTFRWPLGQDCKGLLVQARGKERTVWYWYDGGLDRLTASLTEDEVRDYVTPHLAAGARVTAINLFDSPPERISFNFSSPEGEGGGDVTFFRGCGFALDGISLRGVQAPLRIALDGQLPPQFGRRPEVEAEQAKASNAALAAFGGGPGAVATVDALAPADCTRHVVRVSEGSRQVWYWADGAEGRVLATLTADQARAELSAWLPTGVTAGELLPGGPTLYYIRFAGGATTVSGRLSRGCEFVLEEITLSPGHFTIPVWRPLAEPVSPATAALLKRQAEVVAAGEREALTWFGRPGAQVQAMGQGPHAAALVRVSGGERHAWYLYAYEWNRIRAHLQDTDLERRIEPMLPKGVAIREVRPGRRPYEILFSAQAAGAAPRQGALWVQGRGLRRTVLLLDGVVQNGPEVPLLIP